MTEHELCPGCGAELVELTGTRKWWACGTAEFRPADAVQVGWVCLRRQRDRLQARVEELEAENARWKEHISELIAAGEALAEYAAYAEYVD